MSLLGSKWHLLGLSYVKPLVQVLQSEPLQEVRHWEDQVNLTITISTLAHIIKKIEKCLIDIDTVNQGNWSLSIKLRLKCFVIVK